MEKFVLLILCSSLYSIKANDCTPNSPPCSDVHDIATIKCVTPANPKDVACTMTCKPEDVTCPEGISGLLDIDAGICKEKCREQAAEAAAIGTTAQCKFYRWEEEDQGKCILQTECGKPDLWCQSIDVPRCISGQIGCTEDGTPACSLANPVEYNPDNFHLICHGDHGDTNIYSTDDIMEIPTGTECYTIHKCDIWIARDTDDPRPTYYRKLAVKCSEDGIFEAMDGKTGDDALSVGMIQGPTDAQLLVEPKCESKCDSLVLTEGNIHAEGTELICDAPLVGTNLEDGNSCILICDNHFAMSISCQFEPDGTKIWKNDNRVEVTAATVKC